MSLRSRHTLPYVLLLSGVMAVVTPMMAENPAATPAATANQAKAAQDYGKLPLAFEANRGQADPSVKFLSRGAGYSLFLTGSEAVLALGRPANCKAKTDGLKSKPESCPVNQNAAQQDTTRQDIVQMKLAGATVRHAATATGEAELPGKVNYFIGNDPTKWHSDLPTYSKVRLSRVYPGIDLVYYGNQGQLEYDFVVAPGANPAAIQLSFAGEKDLSIAANGDLILNGQYGSASFHKPVVYQEENGYRQPVAGSFRLQAKNTVSFALGSYDHTHSLVIDPVLVYSTYLGGTLSDVGNGIAVDSVGNAYVVGTTYSTDFPVSAYAFQRQNTSALDGNRITVFVTKLNASGTALLYSTYLGGTGGDNGYGIAVDSSGQAYVTGATYSTNFPTTCGSFQATNPSTTGGASTAFVSELSPGGTRLVYSTYLGGSGGQGTSREGDAAQAIVVQAGKAYVTGYTHSSDFPVTDHAFQTQFAGGVSTPNAFVTELNAAGTGLVYSTYLGGSGGPNGVGDFGNALAIDATGDVFVTGSTNSANFPVTTGALQTNFLGSATAFVAELKPDGSDLVYSTFLGGSGGDSAQAIAVDSQGFAYIGGATSSPDFPLTAGVVEGTNVGLGQYYGPSGGGAFVAKVNQDGTALSYSTYLEGQATVVTGLAVDSAGNAYMAGTTSNLGAGSFGGFQVTPDALSSGGTAFVVKLDPLATVFEYATLLGGSRYDGAIALALDAAGNAYVTGFANSADFPVTAGAFQTVNKSLGGNSSNAFVSKFALAAEANQTSYPNVVSPNIATAISGGGEIDVYCDQNEFTMILIVNLNTDSFGPPPTGTLGIYNDEQGLLDPVPVVGSWGEGFGYETQFTTIDPPYLPFTVNWDAFYSGDSIYLPSSGGGTLSGDGCPPPDFAAPKRQFMGKIPPNQLNLPAVPVEGQPKIVVKVVPINSKDTKSARTPWKVSGPKFTPTAISVGNSTSSLAGRALKNAQGLACTFTRPPLTVTVVPPVPRLYGQANPQLAYSTKGLLNGDTVTVTLQTTATPASYVGSYPVTATVTGAALANYTLTVIDARLYVRPATLHIVASTVAVTYGQTPAQPTAYKLTGLVNGDPALVASGAPVLSTTVTSTTPPGLYKIGIQAGTLTATNYVFTGVSNGEGVVDVRRAPLQLTANSLSMTQGGPVPTLTYTLTGFVNGQGAAGTVTGTPVLTTAATSASRPGKYPITITQGSLASTNYYFQKVDGYLTVLP